MSVPADPQAQEAMIEKALAIFESIVVRVAFRPVAEDPRMVAVQDARAALQALVIAAERASQLETALERIAEQVRLVTDSHWSGLPLERVPADLAMTRLSQAFFSGDEEWDTPRTVEGIIAAVQDGQPTGVIMRDEEEIWGSTALDGAVAEWISERLNRAEGGSVS